VLSALVQLVGGDGLLTDNETVLMKTILDVMGWDPKDIT
jgi:hypothetical protein